MITAACVLRTGKDFHPEHVTRLATDVRRWWPAGMPYRFVALTDKPEVDYGPAVTDVRPLESPWPGWWSKLELFAPSHEDLGDLFFLDLDTLVLGPLDDLLAVGGLTALRDFYRPQSLGSGLLFLPEAERRLTWVEWQKASDIVKRFRRGDGDFLEFAWRGRAKTYWQDVLPGQCISYKVHFRPHGRVPDGARIVCYHGVPRPWTTKLWLGLE